MQRCPDYLLRLPILYYFFIKIWLTLLEVVAIIDLNHDLDIVQLIIRKGRLCPRIETTRRNVLERPCSNHLLDK